MSLLIYISFGLALIFGLFAVYELIIPYLKPQKIDIKLLKRYALMSVFFYLLMAIFLSYQIINKNGYDHRINKLKGYTHRLNSKSENTSDQTTSKRLVL